MTISEQWVNPQWVTPCTVPAGALGAADGVQSGDPEQWDMAGGWAAFGGANEGEPYPEQQFRVFDLHAPSEIILVRQTSGTTTAAQDRRQARGRLAARAAPGPVWDVTRGDQGTVPVAHQPGFAVHNAVTGAGLTRSLAAGVPAIHGLVLPAAGKRGPAVPWTDSQWHPVCELPVPAGEAVPGAAYEITAWGLYQTGTAGAQVLSYQAGWTGATDIVLTDGACNIGTLAGVSLGTVSRWRAHTLVKIYADSYAHGNTLMHLAPSISTTGVQSVDLLSAFTGGPPWGREIDTAGDAVVSLWMKLDNGAGGAVAGGSVTVWGYKAWKAG